MTSIFLFIETFFLHIQSDFHVSMSHITLNSCLELVFKEVEVLLLKQCVSVCCLRQAHVLVILYNLYNVM